MEHLTLRGLLMIWTRFLPANVALEVYWIFYPLTRWGIFDQIWPNLRANSSEKSNAPHMPGVPSLWLNSDRCITLLMRFRDDLSRQQILCDIVIWKQVMTRMTTPLKRRSETRSAWRRKRVCSRGWRSHGSCSNKNWELTDFFESISFFR